MPFKEYWNKTHQKYLNDKIIYDNWLDNYLNIINKCKTEILDLGCGLGNDSLYLTEKGFNVIACDYSTIAVEKVQQEIPNVITKLLDISKPLPFNDNCFDIIIADLSLHYFDEKTTILIMQEIKRILSPNGHLLARVNAINDINYGALQGKKLEDNFYFVDGYNKRFFDLNDAKKYFSIIGKTNIKNTTMLRYAKPKQVIEIDVKK